MFTTFGNALKNFKNELISLYIIFKKSSSYKTKKSNIILRILWYNIDGQ